MRQQLSDSTMEAIGETSLPADSGTQSLCPGWNHLHKPVIVMVMGSLMCAAGGLIFLLRSLGGGAEAPPSVASACLSIGLMFVVMGLVWIPVLKEKQRRKSYSQGCTSGLTLGGKRTRRISSATMSTCVQVEPVTERSYGGVGRCKCSFWFAVAHDILGVFIMMVGVFGGLVIHDLFIYAGAIIIFLSLIWWVFWYSGNIDVPPEELEDDVGLIKLKNRGLSRVVRRVSSRLSSSIRNSFRKNGRSFREDAPGDSRPGAEMSLSTIYDSDMASSSKQVVRDTLSI